MRFPRLPDWLMYACVVAALLGLALNRREHIDAPAPSTPARQAETPRGPAPAQPQQGRPELAGPVLAPASPFDPSVTVDVPEHAGPAIGTAFSVASYGIWVTARHVVDGCRQAALVVGEGQGVAARPQIDAAGEAALLATEGGAAPLPLALDAPLREGELAYHPGFPQGRPGEAASRLIGRENLVVHGRGARTEPVLVWAEVGRTEGLLGSLGGLSGAPALDANGRVIGVTIAEAPRRGRIYTTTPETLARLIASRGAPLHVAPGRAPPLSRDNYGKVADTLRRDLRVAQVVCLT
jgi:S1-C subfamily serine protease